MKTIKKYPLRLLVVYGDRTGMPAAGAAFLAPIVHAHVGTFLRKSRIEALKICDHKWPLIRTRGTGVEQRYWTDLIMSGEYTTDDESGDTAKIKRIKAWSGNKYIWDFNTEKFVPLTGDDVA